MSCGPGTPPLGEKENKSGRMVNCVKFGKELPGLDEAPWPGDLGQKIFESVSMDAWGLWKEHMKMVLNEFRLQPWQPEAKEIIEQQMEAFFFGDGAQLPPDFVPQQEKA